MDSSSPLEASNRQRIFLWHPALEHRHAPGRRQTGDVVGALLRQSSEYRAAGLARLGPSPASAATAAVTPSLKSRTTTALMRVSNGFHPSDREVRAAPPRKSAATRTSRPIPARCDNPKRRPSNCCRSSGPDDLRRHWHCAWGQQYLTL